MAYDKEKIESVLKKGKSILEDRPELANMSLHDVIDELDDGTQEMRGNRWGVTAWLVIKSITNFEIGTLVEQLTKVDSGILTYKYAGYLLLTECGVNLEELILEGERCGQYEKIVLYVSHNLIYETNIYEQYINPILNMLEKHISHNSFHTLLRNYANHIANLNAQCLVENSIGVLNKQIQYELMQQLRWSWYHRDASEASDVIGRLIEYKNIWSKKTAISFLETSLEYDKVAFCRYFSEIEQLIMESEELWLTIIPVFVNFIIKFSADTKESSNELNARVLEYLKRVPSASIKVRYSFLESLQWVNELPEELLSIFHSVILRSFDKDQQLLELLNTILYTQLQKSGCNAVLQIMLEIFCANKYQTDYHDFFNIMQSVNNEMSKNVTEVTVKALKYMLSNNVSQVFFGLGLLTEVGDIQKLQKDIDCTDEFTEAHMIRLMKSILYYTFDPNKIVRMAFQFLEFSNEPNKEYIGFCMKEIYENYPETMHEIAKSYKSTQNEKQAYLAETIIKTHEQSLNEQQQCYKIKDLQQSSVHQYIYYRAQNEQNRQINKKAQEQSVFMGLVNKKTLKYGKRSAHIVTGRKEEKFYQVAPYTKFEYKQEIPAVYIKDPVGFEMQRREYLDEVINDAINNKGLFTSIKRKR